MEQDKITEEKKAEENWTSNGVDYARLGKKLRWLRAMQGKTADTVEYETGIKRNTLYKLETIKPISLPMLCRLADYYNVSVDWLLGRTDDPKSYLHRKG